LDKSVAFETYEEAWGYISSGQMNELSELCDDSFKLELPGIGSLGLGQAMEVAAAWRDGFSDFGRRRETLTVIESASGREVAVEHLDRLTHDGDFVMPDGTKISPTNRELALRTTDFFIIDRDGQAIRWSVMFDTAELVRQLTQ
jgi:hypothetical protein